MENPMSLLREEDVEALLGTLGDGVGPSPGRDEAAGRLRTVRRELAFLASVGFPLPSRLSVEEWVRLLTLRRRASRNRYLDWLGRQGGEGGGEGHHDDGGSGFDSILSAEEAETTTPVRLESSWFSSAAAADGLSDAEVEDRLSLLTSVAEDLRSSGRLLPLLPPKRERHLRELLRAATTDEGAAKALHYLACNRRAEEETDFVLRRARERHRELVTRFQAETRRRVEEEEGRIYYATFSNSIFLRLTKKRMARENRWRVVREFMPWGSPVVVDLSFLGASPPLGAGADGDNNSARLSRRTCSGLKTAVKMNATSRVPSALYFANYDAGAVKELTLLREVFPTDGYGTSSCEVIHIFRNLLKKRERDRLPGFFSSPGSIPVHIKESPGALSPFSFGVPLSGFSQRAWLRPVRRGAGGRVRRPHGPGRSGLRARGTEREPHRPDSGKSRG